MAGRTRLMILFGGRSAEHEVSCVSALHVADAADSDRYEVFAVGITRGGRWRLAEQLADRLEPSGASVTVTELLAEPNTVVFPLVHGPTGEDGTLQGLLEMADVPYVGAGVLASAMCMDKTMTKLVLAQHGLPQCRHRAVHATKNGAADISDAVDELGLPLFVKPANMGSSIGISRATTQTEAANAVEVAARYDEWILLEEAVPGRELEVSVLGNHNPRASLPGEIVLRDTFYDYDEKYGDSGAELCVPADLPEEVIEQVQDLALTAYRALRVEGMARVDFFYEPDGRGLLINELNTIPGFTPISMYPALWDASGLPIDHLIDELVGLALERHQRRQQRQSTR